MRILKYYVFPLVLVLLLVVAVRYFVVGHYVVSAATRCEPLRVGDRILVLKQPFCGVRRGDIYVFCPAQGATFGMARLKALPGDTVGIDANGRIQVPYMGTQAGFHAFALPGKCDPVDITPQNVRFYALMLQRFERRSCVIRANGTLVVEGKPLSKVHFHHDFCWMEGIGIVTRQQLIGKAFLITYSIHQQEWVRNRTLMPL